eukprot:s659_g5.t2
MEEHSENLKQLQTQASVNLTPTPQRQRTPEGATPATFEALPPEVYSLTWPTAFLESPRGERLELTEEASHATRSSGITKGVALVGPLSLERGLAYFEVEVAEMESKCSQSMALGFCPVLPETRSSALRAERARELRRATLLGYDLPKIYADGQEAGKINTKQWRPLKDLSAGSRIGLLIDRNAWELTVFMNGCRKVTVSIPTDGSQRPTEVWGIVDIHGNVRSVRLRGNSEIRPTASPALPAPPQWALQVPRTPARLASTQEHASTPLAGRDIPPRSLFEEENPPSKKFSVVEVTASAKKRLRLSAHPCGCIAHLLDINRSVIHLPRQADFVIGRNPQQHPEALAQRRAKHGLQKARRHRLCRRFHYDHGLRVSERHVCEWSQSCSRDSAARRSDRGRQSAAKPQGVPVRSLHAIGAGRLILRGVVIPARAM